MGSIPALVLRLCCVVFLVLWIASVLAVPALSWVEVVFWPGVSSTVVQLVAVGATALVFVTGLQSARTVGRLALFTNKLGIALLLAALIRVHGGFPMALNGFGHGDRSALELWQGLSRLVFYAGPLALLASNFGYRSQSRKQVTMIGLGGLVLPIFGTLLLTGLINIATLNSPVYQASLNPTVGMALWAHAASSALPPRMMFAAITVFGAMRFGARALADFVPMHLASSPRSWIWPGGLVLAVAWFGLHQDAPDRVTVLDISATILIAAAAVVTAGVITGAHRDKRVRRIDWVGTAALLAGLACLPIWMRVTGAEPWTHTWLLPSYGMAMLVCLVGRSVGGSRKAPEQINAKRAVVLGTQGEVRFWSVGFPHDRNRRPATGTENDVVTAP